jgi:hypothetical protein
MLACPTYLATSGGRKAVRIIGKLASSLSATQRRWGNRFALARFSDAS